MSVILVLCNTTSLLVRFLTTKEETIYNVIYITYLGEI